MNGFLDVHRGTAPAEPFLTLPLGWNDQTRGLPYKICNIHDVAEIRAALGKGAGITEGATFATHHLFVRLTVDLAECYPILLSNSTGVSF